MSSRNREFESLQTLMEWVEEEARKRMLIKKEVKRL